MKINREDRRKYTQFLLRKGVSENNIKDFFKRNKENIKSPEKVYEGQKVKIDIVKILFYKDYEKFSSSYKQWIKKNQDKVFTVEYDPYRKENNTKDVNLLVQLKEDETKPKWLFFVNDLIMVDNNNLGSKIKEDGSNINTLEEEKNKKEAEIYSRELQKLIQNRIKDQE